MAEDTTLSADETDKMAMYKQATKDRQEGVTKLAEAVAPDGGMTETGEMPAAPMTADQPITSWAADTAPGAMPKPGMDGGADPPPTAGGEMPRPPMN